MVLYIRHGVPAETTVSSESNDFESRLWKPTFDRYFSLERRQRLLHDFNASAFRVDIPDDIAVQKFSRDASDDAFVHAAITARVVRLVSGDDDLLCLHRIGALHVLSPRVALDEIAAT